MRERERAREAFVDVVLVSWRVAAEDVAGFKEQFKRLDPATNPGLLREDLYRLEDGPDDGTVRFLRVGRWIDEHAFYRALAPLGVVRGKKPASGDFEQGDRRREWLRWVRDDYPVVEDEAFR